MKRFKIFQKKVFNYFNKNKIHKKVLKYFKRKYLIILTRTKFTKKFYEAIN